MLPDQAKGQSDQEWMSKRMYSIIPDLHADPQRLTKTLLSLGQDAPLAFLGDFIDGKGLPTSDDLSVLRRVKLLIESGEAVGVMGNHELNAILFHRNDAQGRPLRAHTADNKKQHRSFIDQFGIGTRQAMDWTDWFLTALPLWHDLGGLRLAHACWSDSALAIVKDRRPDGFLHPDDLAEIAAETTAFGKAVKAVVSGPEARLPEPFSFQDINGKTRHYVRLAWWRNGAETWRKAALSVPDDDDLPAAALPPDVQAEIYACHQPPVFVGHYKMSGSPNVEAANALCLDYPLQPCAYRWRGETVLTAENLVLVQME